MSIRPSKIITNLLFATLLNILIFGNHNKDIPFKKESIPSIANIEERPFEKFENASSVAPNSKEINPDSQIDGLSFVSFSTTW